MTANRYVIIPILIFFAVSMNYCITEDKSMGKRDIRLLGYNLKFVGYDENIHNPEFDRRAFYKIYIDKLESGRTTIGLESQMKTFKSNISNNRHLLIVEKWILNKKKMKYVKLNNIDQPKPNYFYFNLSEEKAVVITLKNDILTRRASFSIEYK